MVTYPFIRFVCKYGRSLSLYSGLSVALLSALAAYLYSSPMLFLWGLICSMVLAATLRLISEIVEVVADALLPR